MVLVRHSLIKDKSMDKADLHIHTTSSDGILTPEEVVEWAYRKGLHTIAITDHDTVDGIDRAIEEGKEHSICVVPGIELSCTYQNEEVHILGYFIDYKSNKLNTFTKTLKDARENRNASIIEKLNKLDIDITLEEVKKASKNGTMGRPHIARVLIEKGIVDTVKGAFDIYLGKGKPAYVERYKVSIEDAIDLIHSIGGASIVAHPGLMKNKLVLDYVLQQNIDGMEVIHSKHTLEQTEKLRELAKKFNLIETAGSDCHGYLENEEPILGDFYINLKSVKLLKQKADFYKKML
ncbi:PHP domain-containing protein [Gottschalkia acidurici 9a]|uniref:PHP domain-containing protein n=2 Tax=Clostridium acidurici TaxID=1556 RepID=K0B0F5_GOTA9|nr:PHP domain-containing protein [Gottschalkia acidurici 9a]